VALRKANGQADLTMVFIKSVEVWIQLHYLPPEVFSLEGVALLIGSIDMILSEVCEFFMNNKVYKVKSHDLAR
jgi:hypothetical protein